MSVPFLDLGRLHETIRPELDEAIDRVIGSSAFIGGEEVRQFEEAFALAHERAFAVGCASGTDALSLALRALDVGPGDEVVVPSMTFFATAEAVVHAGATPVIADVDPTTLLLAPEQVDAVRTGRTRAVIPVHLYGHVVDFSHIEHWRSQGLRVVEDAAQAHLARWGTEVVGSRSDAACFSFFPGKNLGAMGDGGAVVTDDSAVAQRVRTIRDHGRSEKYVHNEVGVSSRLDGLQAAILRVKLGHLEVWTAGRAGLAELYRRCFDCIDEVTLVPWANGAVHHLLVARVRSSVRDSVRSALGEAGIATGIHYPVPLSEQPGLSASQRRCPASELAATEVLSLPMDPLMTDADVEIVVDAVGRSMMS